MGTQPIAALNHKMPAGVAVTSDERIFLCYPRWCFPGWSDYIECSVCEWRAGQTEPFPNARINTLDFCDPAHHFLCVQSVVAAGASTLWVLDSGSPYFLPALPGGAKLVEVDIPKREVRRSYQIPHGIARFGTYLNDVRFDFNRGAAGTAYITDSAPACPSAIIVIDLATGRKLRRLDGHRSVDAQPDGTPVINEQALRVRLPGGLTFACRNGSDGIALSPDGNTLYYCPLISRRLYSVDATLLADPNVSDEDVANSVLDLGQKAVSDGLGCDDQGRVYASDLEHNCIRRRDAAGNWSVVAADERMIWTDSMAFGPDGSLYHTSNQINRMPMFNYGRDYREQPYYLFRSTV